MSRPFPTAGTRGFVSVNDRCGAFAAARVRRPSIQNIRERYFNNVPGLLPQTLSRIHSGEKNVEISNYVTSPRQKQPQISPIFISDKVTLHVSREKDGKLRLGYAGWDDTKVLQPDGWGRPLPQPDGTRHLGNVGRAQHSFSLDFRYENDVPDRADRWLAAVERRQMQQQHPRHRERRASFNSMQSSSL